MCEVDVKTRHKDPLTLHILLCTYCSICDKQKTLCFFNVASGGTCASATDYHPRAPLFVRNAGRVQLAWFEIIFGQKKIRFLKQRLLSWVANSYILHHFTKASKKEPQATYVRPGVIIGYLTHLLLLHSINSYELTDAETKVYFSIS